MSKELDELHDAFALETDRRKIQRLLDDGVITDEELANATVHMLESNCDCGVGHDENDRCPRCLTKWSEVEL